MSTPGHELTITRFIAAPPARVWDVMTNRQEEWWCPTPWRAEFDKLDKRPGGDSLVTMYGPNGEVNKHDGFVLAFTDAIKPDLMPDGPFMIGIWMIEPAKVDGVDGTRYTAAARHWSEETMKNHAEMGFDEGWGACADQLKALCESGSGEE
jgi:uncharacterized protein YndB with AHSA1/START domain